MTLQQEAYNRIDQMSDDGVRFFLNMMDSLQGMSVADFKSDLSDSRVDIGAVNRTKRSGEEAKKGKNIILLSEIMDFQSKDDEDYVSARVIDNTLGVVFHLVHQPEIFKTGRNSLHLQFELSDKSYMELEVFEDRITCMVVPKRQYECAEYPDVSLGDMAGINEIVRKFYGA